MKYFLIIILLSSFLLNFGIFAQDNNDTENIPLWLSIDNAIQKVEFGESGEAIYLFRKILEKYPGNPESEMWIGLLLNKEKPTFHQRFINALFHFTKTTIS